MCLRTLEVTMDIPNIHWEAKTPLQFRRKAFKLKMIIY